MKSSQYKATGHGSQHKKMQKIYGRDFGVVYRHVIGLQYLLGGVFVVLAHWLALGPF